MDDPALALHALVADSALVEIRSHGSTADAEPLYISCLDGKVSLRRALSSVSDTASRWKCGVRVDSL